MRITRPYVSYTLYFQILSFFSLKKLNYFLFSSSSHFLCSLFHEDHLFNFSLSLPLNRSYLHDRLPHHVPIFATANIYKATSPNRKKMKKSRKLMNKTFLFKHLFVHSFAFLAVLLFVSPTDRPSNHPVVSLSTLLASFRARKPTGKTK